MGLYEFRDLNPATDSSDNPYPAEALNINGEYLEDLVQGYRTLQVTGREILNQDVSLVPVGRANGQRLRYTRYDSRTITVKYQLSADTPKAFRDAFYTLSAKLRVQETARLIFNDDPSVYWNGVFQEAEIPDGGRLSVVSSFDFIVPDGLAHATTPTVVSGLSPLKLPNVGTAPAWPIYKVTMKSENGYVQIGTPQGYVEFGDPEQVDTTEQSKASKVVNIDYRSEPTAAGYAMNTNCVTVYPQRLFKDGDEYTNHMVGTLQYGEGPTKEAATSAFDDGTPAGGMDVSNWHGPAVHFDVPEPTEDPDSTDFSYKARAEFQAGGGMGREEFTLESGGLPAFSIVIRDSSNYGKTKIMECWQGTTIIDTHTLSAKSGTFFETSITRQGDSVLYKFAQITKMTSDTSYKAGYTYKYPLNVDGLADVPIDGITQWMMAYGEIMPVDMYWTDTKFTWTNVEYTQNEPNFFNKSDEFVVDPAHRKAYLNGVESGLYTVGNNWDALKVYDPSTPIAVIPSSWAEPPEVEVTLEEAYY